MGYIIAAVVVIFALIVAYGAWARRQIYKSVDQLDQRKSKVVNEPIAEEISRVKGLTISGETEENFERWRQTWDTIVEERFPEIEMKLFDIEEAANKYRFRSAKEKITSAESYLHSVETEIDLIRKEVDHLVQSEEQNRNEIDEVTSAYRDTRALLSRKWQSLGGAEQALESEMKECRQELESYQKDTEEGNYTRARERLLVVKETIARINKQIEKIPQMTIDIEVEFPEQIRELQSGMKEMEGQGFSFTHFTIAADLNEIESSLAVLKKAVSELKLDYVGEQLKKNNDLIEKSYDLLEKEATAKNAVVKGTAELTARHRRLVEHLDKLDKERTQVEESYQLSEEEKNKHEQIKKELLNTEKEQRVFEDMFNNQKQSFIDLKDTLVKVETQFTEIEKSVKQSLVRLHDLRRDELRAVEKLKELRRWMIETQLNLQRSHLPAVPEKLVEQLKAANKELEKATALLEMKPLEIKSVQESVELSRHEVGKASHTLKETIERAAWAERLLQFGNRYRSEFESLQSVLDEAEWQFRNGYYEESVEKLSQALERYVPLAVSQLEADWEDEERPLQVTESR